MRSADDLETSRTGGASRRRNGTARPSLYARLVVAIGVLCLSLIVGSAFMIWHSRIESLHAATSQVDNLALSLAQQAADALTIDETALTGLVDRIEADGTSPRQLLRLHHVAVKYVASIASLHGLFVVDRRGHLLASALKAAPAGLSFSDREDFRFNAAHTSLAYHIGPAIRSRSDGTQIFTISRRLEDDHGKFAGMAACTISVSYFQKLYGSVQLGQDGSIVLIRDDGSVLVATPSGAANTKVGKTILSETSLAHVSSAHYTATSLPDGLRRIDAYRRLDRFPIAILVAAPEAEALESWRSDAATALVAVAVLVFTISALGVYLGIEVRNGQRMEAELAQLAFRDGLTGVANRRSFDDMLERELRRATRDHSVLSVLMIDVDLFKSFNDTYGHQRGDEVLQTIATCAAQGVKRPGDFVARYGGEEFVVLLPATSATDAFAIAESIRCAVQHVQIVSSAAPAGIVTISVGAASMVAGVATDPRRLVRAADTALYAAKGRGRNQTVSAETLLSPT